MHLFSRAHLLSLCWAACSVAAAWPLAAAAESLPAGEEAMPPQPKPEPWQARGLRAALAESSPLLRSHAVQYLAERGWVRQFLTVQDLRPLLQSADEKISGRAMQALAQLGPQATASCVKEVVPLLHHAEGGTRVAAVKALAQKGRGAVPYAREIIPLLDDRESAVRDAAVHTLATLGRAAPADIVALLRPLLELTPDKAEPAPAAASRPAQRPTTAPAAALRPVQPFAPAAAKSATIPAPGLRLPPGMSEEDLRRTLSLLRSHAVTKFDLTKAQAAANEDAGTNAAANTEEDTATASGLQLSPDANVHDIVAALRLLKRGTVQVLGHMGPDAAPLTVPLLLPLQRDSLSGLKNEAEEALRTLGSQGAPAAVQAQLARLADRERAVQYQALESLAVADPHAAPPSTVATLMPLVQALKAGKGSGAQPDRPLRILAVETLAHLADPASPETVAAFLPLLQDPDPPIRARAAAALGKAGTQTTPQVIRALRPLLEDPADSVVFAAANALMSAGRETAACRKALQPLLRMSADYRARCHTLATLLKMEPRPAPELVHELIAVLEVPDPHAAIAAAGYLREMGPRLAPYLQEVLPLLHKQGPEVQVIVMGALTRVGPAAAPRVARALLPLLEKQNDMVRSIALQTLASLGPAVAPQAVPALLARLQVEKSDNSRGIILAALGSMGPAAAPHASQLLLQFKDYGAGFETVYPPMTPYGLYGLAPALGKMGPGIAPAVVPTFVQYLKKDDPTLSREIHSAFAQMGRSAARTLTPAVLPLLRHRDTQSEALQILSLSGNFTLRAAWQCAALAAVTEQGQDEDTDRDTTSNSDTTHSNEDQNNDALQALRFHLHLWSGHDPALLLSVRWLGHPTDNPIPAHGLSAAEQRAALRAFLQLWNSSAPYPSLRREIAQRSADVAQSITRAPDPKLAALLTRMDTLLENDPVQETQPTSATARRTVQSALLRRVKR